MLFIKCRQNPKCEDIELEKILRVKSKHSWKKEEHRQFVNAVRAVGKRPIEISARIPSRSLQQVRSYIQCINLSNKLKKNDPNHPDADVYDILRAQSAFRWAD